MTKNPIINACAATAYISAVAFMMFYGTKTIQVEETIFIPIAMLSLFVLSAAVMGYIFLFEPLQYFLNGDRVSAMKLFLQTVAIFAGITALVFIFLLIL